MIISEISLICFPEINPHKNFVKIHHLPPVILDSDKVKESVSINDFLRCIYCKRQSNYIPITDVLESLLYTQNNIECVCSGELKMSVCYAISENENIIYVQFVTISEHSQLKDIFMFMLAIESLNMSNLLSVEIMWHLFKLLRPVFKQVKSSTNTNSTHIYNWLRVVEGFIFKKLTHKLCYAMLGEAYQFHTTIKRCCLENTVMSDLNERFQKLRKLDHSCNTADPITLHKNWKNSLYEIHNIISKNYNKLENLTCIL
jgi:hypothetical protein